MRHAWHGRNISCRVQGTAQTNQTCIDENTAAYPVPSRDLISHRTRPPASAAGAHTSLVQILGIILAPKNMHARTAACLARHARFRPDLPRVARLSALIRRPEWHPAPVCPAPARFWPQSPQRPAARNRFLPHIHINLPNISRSSPVHHCLRICPRFRINVHHPITYSSSARRRSPLFHPKPNHIPLSRVKLRHHTASR